MTTSPALRTLPYWWERSPPPPAEAPVPLPAQVDVAIVGAGYSGLFTALALARGGREVAVLEAGRPGEHASTKNFGAIGRTIRIKFSELQARDGLEVAKRVYEEAKEWVEFTAGFIERERLDCGFRRAGRVVGAHHPGAFEAMARELEHMRRHVAVDTHLLPRSEQHRELGTDVYHGCAVLNDVGHLDPGRYFAGLLGLVRNAGVALCGQTRVLHVFKEKSGFTLQTDRGSLRAREVVLATNAETSADNGLFRYFRRRLVPVTVYSVVTEPLDEALLAAVLPTGRTVLETRRLYLGLRPIVGEGRLLAVSRHMGLHRDEVSAAAAVGRDLVARYPQLRDVRSSHCWRGRFCVTFDWLPHLGVHEGVHYLLGMNGAGVPASGYLGHKLAQRMLGRPNRETVFADRPFPTVPGFTGSGWFLPVLATAYRAADRREAHLGR